MTITSTINRKEYTGNGVTTDFAFPFYVLASGDLTVFLDGVLQVIVTDYTLSLTPPQTAGVDVQFLTAPASAKSVVILRDPAVTQSTDLIENDPLPAEELEKTVDRLTMICQRLDERLGRAAVLPDTDVSGASPLLPAPLANAHIVWNSTADALTTATALAGSETVSAFGATLIDDADAPAARLTLGLGNVSVKALSDAFAWTGVHTFTGLSPLKFDGAVAGGDAITFTFTEPTAARTVTFPDANVDLTLVRAASDTVTGVIEIAVTSEMVTGTSTTLAITPGRLKDHFLSPKVLVACGITGNILGTSENVSSITDTGAGKADVIFDTDFASANYIPVMSVEATLGYSSFISTTKVAGSIRMANWIETVTASDPNEYGFAAWGLQ